MEPRQNGSKEGTSLSLSKHAGAIYAQENRLASVSGLQNRISRREQILQKYFYFLQNGEVWKMGIRIGKK